MSKVYVNQNLPLRLATTIDLTDADEVRIYYVSPVTEAEGYFTASVYGDAEDGVIEHVCENGDLYEAGKWKFYAYVVWSGSSPSTVEFSPGEPAYLTIYEEGN